MKRSYIGLSVALLAIIPVGLEQHWQWSWRTTVAALGAGILAGVIDLWVELHCMGSKP